MPQQPTNPWKVAIVALVTLVILVVMAVGGAAGCKTYTRAQRRADARNEVQVAKINARRNRAQIAATVAEAEKRYRESIGIRRAQDEISKTLTPLYVQHEAIQAQRASIGSSNHTEVFIPSGPNGVPIVKPVGPVSP